MPVVNLFRPGKAPGDSLPFSWDWSSFMDPTDSIISAQVTSSPAGLSIGTPSISGDTVTVVIAGGTSGTAYQVNCAITTAAGNIANSQEVLRVLDSVR